MIIFSAFAAVFPMLLYLILVWKYDRYDREPLGLVLLNYFWGAIGAIILTFLLSSVLGNLLNILFSGFYVTDETYTILFAPIIEELTKGLFLIITVQNKKFDNLTDGIVYGTAIGLGFGMTENFLYFVQNSNSLGTWVYVVTIRTLFSAVMHGLATGTFGAFIGSAKFKYGYKKYLIPGIGLLIAIIIHASWNSFVSFTSTILVGIMFMLVTTIIFIVVFTLSISKERQIIFSELLEESQNGLIPAEHLSIINSSLRNKSGWIDEKIRKIYVASAIKLAFKKIQFKNSTGLNKKYFEAEIDNLRSSISLLLEKN